MRGVTRDLPPVMRDFSGGGLVPRYFPLRNWSETTSRFVLAQKIAKDAQGLHKESFASLATFCSNSSAQIGMLFCTMSLAPERSFAVWRTAGLGKLLTLEGRSGT